MHRKKVLIAEDHLETAELVARIAGDYGCEVQIVSTARGFKDAIQDFRPDAMILDMLMPETDGIELLRFLGQVHSQARIIIASGSHPQILSAARRLGDELELRMVGLLEKPYSVADLESMLRRALNVRHRATGEELRRAIAEREITAFFQPKVTTDPEARRIVGLEALARWIHPDFGVILPSDFVPAAEQSGLIDEMTWVIIEEVTTNLQYWQENGLSCPCSVNLSPRMLQDLALPDRLSENLADKGLSRSLLTLELTESAAIQDFARTIDILSRFRLKGFGLSLDDFGTGYSSLTHLVRFPFNELKIDRSFVSDIGKHTDSETVIRSTVVLAHHLGIRVCAEGVESEESLDFLLEAGVDTVQGYLISKPISADRVIRFAKSYLTA